MLRAKLLDEKQDIDGEDRFRFRAAFWDGLYEMCSDNQAFSEAFGDQTARMENKDYWTSFGIGLGNCHVDAHVGKRDRYAETGIYYPHGVGYHDLYAKRLEIEKSYADAGAEFIWSEPDSTLKGRAFLLRRQFDYDTQDWTEAQEWMMNLLLRLRTTALSIHSH